MTIRLIGAALIMLGALTAANAYTVTRFDSGAHPAAKKPTTCSGLGRICKGMGSRNCDAFVESCKATGTWNSKSLTVTGVPKK
jgi:hypothetical protein